LPPSRNEELVAPLIHRSI